MQRRHLLLAAVWMGVTSALPLLRPAQAETYPARPITVVVPFPAGGPSDVTARILADRMRDTLGQPLVIENVGGAAGSIGTGRVARAAPDGYTLVLGYWGTHVANAALYKLTYDVQTDFEPVALLPSQPQILVGKKGLPVDDLKGLIAWLKANPEKASQGTAGVGTRPPPRPAITEADGNSVCVRSISRGSPGHAGSHRRSDRHRFQYTRGVTAAVAVRLDQSICRHGQEPVTGRPGHSDRG